MTYDARKVRLNTLSGETMVGWTFRLGSSRLGQTSSTRTEAQVASIDMTDGYEAADTGALSIDPMTGSATISERFRPGASDTVASKAPSALKPGDRIEIAYGQAIVQQGAITKVTAKMDSVGAYWVRRTMYEFSGPAGIMLKNTATWPSQAQEPALTRLARYFKVNTSLLTSAMMTYLGGILMPGTNAGSGTYLDIARAFTTATKFPLRTFGVSPDHWREIQVVPAVTFQGALPKADIVSAESWCSAADFVADTGASFEAISIDVKKNYDAFISGITSYTVPGNKLGSFQLGTSRLGAGGAIPVGIRVPVVIDVFGTRLIVSKIGHSFSPSGYRSTLDLVKPVEVG